NAQSAADALPQDFINQVASQIAAPARARFKEPDYDKAMQRLAAAGFSAYDAERIFAMEAEAQLRFIDTMSNPALRGSVAARDIIADLGDKLREYLGDYGYENYLRSKNLPTTVTIYRVEDDSAGALVGLHKGDEIVRYAGRRVYSITGLNRLVAQGQSGQRVSLQLLRQGNIETIEIPAGAIGITSRPLSPRAVFDLH
ncbi:MAG: PDZ domain-containing protein, partial [Gammaproteobacteria bacterium]|nr:PDZ domain-containing protein [Gammaproteobacteria bacterium]